MSTFHLRPISHSARSSESSPSPSSSTASEHSSPTHRDQKHGSSMSSPQDSRPRRPLSPSSLRDVDLSTNHNMSPRKYPAPPTGHELMALFPPAPPVNVCTGPTSGFFQAEERAFFAQAGKEIVRVRIEVDMPRDGEAEPFMKSRSRESVTVSRQWPVSSPHSQPRSPLHTSPVEHLPPASSLPQHNTPRIPRSGPVTVTTQPVYPIMSHGSPQQSYPPHLHSPSHGSLPTFPIHSSPQDRSHMALAASAMEVDELRDDPDESWRRPIPHNQRRRAGKHTKRVVVK